MDFFYSDESRYESAKKQPKVGNLHLRGSLEVIDGLQKQNVVVCCAEESRDEPAEGEWPVYARLTGPNRALSAAGFFYIDLEFENDDPVLTPDEDDSLPWGVWSFARSHNIYDGPQYPTMSCKYGDVAMKYVVMDDAAAVYVETFLRSENAPAKIHGKITTENTFGEILHFEKDACEDIEVRPGVRPDRGLAIPLSRRVISLPIDRKLIIRADVRAYNSDLFSYKDIVRGRAELHPEVYQTTKASINGAYSETLHP